MCILYDSVVLRGRAHQREWEFVYNNFIWARAHEMYET